METIQQDPAVKTYTREEALAASREYFIRQGLAYGLTRAGAEANAQLQADAFVGKYALSDPQGVFYEATPADMHDRLADAFAQIEARYPNPVPRATIRGLLDNFNALVPQGSPMFAIGNVFQLASVSNCVVVPPPDDNMSSITQRGTTLANLFKRRAGVGIDLSTLRPAGAPVNNAARTSTGAASFMDYYSYVTRMVGQSGRRGALMETIDVRHPDVDKFITAKVDKTKVTGANISVRVSDEFMRAVEQDADFTLQWPVDVPPEQASVTRVVKARELFRLVAETACATAEPGVLMWDTITRRLPLHVYPSHKTSSTNPCGEAPLSPYDTCRLLSIPVFRYVRDPFTAHARFDFDEFLHDVAVGQRLADDIVDIELDHLALLAERADTQDERLTYLTMHEVARQGRRTGLGTHGHGDMLVMLGLRYDSTEAVVFVEELQRRFKLAAYRASVELAKERGQFPMYNSALEADHEFIKELAVQDPELYLDMVTYGRRNGALLLLAPTGTVSLMCNNCSSGMEPIFRVKTKRRRKVDPVAEGLDPATLERDASGDYWTSYTFLTPVVERYLKLAYDDPETYPVYTATGERVLKVTESWEEFVDSVVLPEYFVTADQLDWKYRVQMQATITHHIDHSVSTTVNLPQGTTPDVIEAIYLEAWKSGCKGMTVYVDGSRDAQVLSDANAKPPEAQPAFEIHPTVEEAQIEALEDRVRELRDALDTALATSQRSSSVIPRGRQTSGDMTKAAFRDAGGFERKVYVYVGANDDGQPAEVFVTDEKAGDEVHPYASALGKLVSLALKHGIPAPEVARSIIGLQGGSVSYDGGIFTSVPDMVGKLLRDAAAAPMVTLREVPAPPVLNEPAVVVSAVESIPTIPQEAEVAVARALTGRVIATGMVGKPTVPVDTSPLAGYAPCPNCRQRTLLMTGGCPRCENCGHSNCG
jgi:ribonucleoside-diphosphate reductase alpha chain